MPNTNTPNNSIKAPIDRLTGRGIKAFQRGDQIYALLEGPLTWTQARRRARKLGGDLVSINSADENRYLTRKFSPLAADDCGLWIGLRRVSSGFRWSDGSRSRYRHWVPAGTPGYPIGMPSDDPAKPYVHIYFNPNAKGYWKNADRTYHDVVISGAIAEFNL
jgi:hypothetical protein